MSLTVFLIIHGAVTYDYPFREACRSAMGVADELLLLCDPRADDGTEAQCREVKAEFAPTTLLIRPWWVPDELGCLERAVNRCIERVRTDHYLWLPADEVLHEAEAPLLRERLAAGGFDMANVGHVHFWESFDWVFSGEGVTCQWAPLVGRRALYPDLRCADRGANGLGDPDGMPGLREASWQDEIHLYHYGYVREGQAALRSHAAKAGLFRFPPDPRPRVNRRGRVEWGRGDLPATAFSPFTGAHPAVMQDWIQARR